MVSMRRLPPTIHRMEPLTHMCEGVMVCRKGEGGFEGGIGWLVGSAHMFQKRVDGMVM